MILDTHKGKIEGERQNGCWGEGTDGVDGVRERERRCS